MTAFNTGALTPLPSSATQTDKRVYEPSMEEILASIRRIIADDQSLPGRGANERNEERPEPAELRRTSADPDSMNTRLGLEAVADPLRAENLAAPTVAPDPARAKPAPTLAAPAAQHAPSSHESPGLVGSPSGGHAHGTVTAPQYPMPDRGFEDLDEVEAPQPPTYIAENGGIRGGGSPRAHGEDVPPSTEAASAPTPDDRIFEEPLEPQPAPASLFSAATDSSVSSAFNVLAASRLADNSDELMNLVREMIRPLLRNWLDDNLPSMVERMVRAEIERVARGGR